MKTRYHLSCLLGILLGTSIAGGSISLAVGITATRAVQPVYLNGQKAELEACNVENTLYVRLRDVCQMLDVNVYWDGANVQIDTGSPYTGEAPAPDPAASVQPTPTASQPAQDVVAATDNVDALRQDIVDRINAVRVANGVSALPTDPMLMKAAQVRAEEMAATGCYSHTRPDGTRRTTATDCIYTAENIHRITVKTAEETEGGLPAFCVLGWKCSQGHLQNMIQPDSAAIGVGLALGVNDYGAQCWYCVAWFLGDGHTITWVDTPKIP